jgi:hypothetical protein
MFHTEHSRVILTFPSTSVSLRRDTGECHSQLHPRPPIIPPLPELIVVFKPKSLGPNPVHHWQRSRLNEAARIRVGSALPGIAQVLGCSSLQHLRKEATLEGRK